MSSGAIDFSILVGPQVPVRSFSAGTTIFKKGDLANELYVIQSGTVCIQLGNRTLDTLSANGIFGEMALIDSAPRSATAVSYTHLTLPTILRV